jgi:SH3 domain-containing YSC84-like protein 1
MVQAQTSLWGAAKMKKLAFRIAVCAAMMASVTCLGWSIDKAEETNRVENAAKVLTEITATPDKGIPDSIMKNARCVAVVPSLVKAGFVFGGQYGRGVASCHTATGWSAPAPILIGGGSWGLQIGGEAVDLVLLIMNDKGMENLLSSKFKLGADASAAAGPVGRQAQADTDATMRAEVLTYSRARGIFAGVTLNGAVIKQDEDATLALYGKDATYQNILRGEVKPTEGAASFLAALKKFSDQAQTANAEPHSQPVQH